MSAGRIAFANEGLAGVYECLPERLSDIIVKKHAQLYNELYAILTEKEKKELNGSNFPGNELERIDHQIKEAKDELNKMRNNLYNSEPERLERFKDMPEITYEASKREFKGRVKELEIKFSCEAKERIIKRQELSLMFN